MTESERKALIDTGLRARAYRGEATIFYEPGQRARIVLGPGERIVCLMRGGQVQALPIEHPGGYTFEPQLLPGASWPFVMFVIESAHVEAWLALDDAGVEALLTRCEAEIARAHGRMQ